MNSDGISVFKMDLPFPSYVAVSADLPLSWALLCSANSCNSFTAVYNSFCDVSASLLLYEINVMKV